MQSRDDSPDVLNTREMPSSALNVRDRSSLCRVTHGEAYVCQLAVFTVKNVPKLVTKKLITHASVLYPFYWSASVSRHSQLPQPFYGPFSGTTRVSRCQKRTSGFYGARED